MQGMSDALATWKEAVNWTQVFRYRPTQRRWAAGKVLVDRGYRLALAESAYRRERTKANSEEALIATIRYAVAQYFASAKLD